MDPLYEDPVAYVQYWDASQNTDDLETAAIEARIEKIIDPAVRNKILDMYVSMGREGIILAQRCVGAVEDGGCDNITITLWNSNSPPDLLWKLANTSLTYYAKDGTLTEEEDMRARCLGVVDQYMPLGLTKSLKEKIHEQISLLKQHGRRAGTRLATKGQGTQRSSVDKGQKV